MDSAKYYAKFLLFGTNPQGVDCEGVIEFSSPIGDSTPKTKIEGCIARYFEEEVSDVKLIYISRLH